MEVDDSFSTTNGSTSSTLSLAPGRPEDTFRILIATDIHLGVHEKDPIRADDSFNTFEEILVTAKNRNVDFILLGGDLFHDSKPSQPCYVKAISLIREHTMGDKPIIVDFLSDRSALHNSVIGDVNYQDPNQNVSYPIFSIHGNHDDACGFGRTSALDVLSASGQINYFGVCKDLTNILLKPIKMKKGKTNLAIYGISHVRDERLSRLMASGSVQYEELPNPDSWFKILVLHQNRVARTGTRHIENEWIPAFIDVVIWGHEHECRITPERVEVRGKEFYIIQPGSPVATSLCEAEAVEKKIGVLNIYSKQFNLEEIKLETVRPFVFHTESTKNWKIGAKRNQAKEFENLATRFINTRLMPLAERMLTGHHMQPKIPLIRLRLELDDNTLQFNTIRFGQQYFSNTVANVTDIITFKTAFSNRASRKDNVFIDAADLEDLLDTSEMKAEALAPQFFENEENRGKQLQVLGIVGMCEAVTSFIEKDDKNAINAMINHQVQKTFEFIKEQKDLSHDKTVIHSLIERFKEMRSSATPEEEVESARRYLESDTRLDVTDVLMDYRGMQTEAAKIKSQQESTRDAASIADSDSDSGFAPVLTNTSTAKGRGRGRGRGRASKASTTTRANTSSRSSVSSVDHVISDDDDIDLTVTSKSRGRGRGTRASTSFRASGRSSVASSVQGNGTLLNFVTRKSSNTQASDNDLFGDFPSATPKKKARIQYGDDSD